MSKMQTTSVRLQTGTMSVTSLTGPVQVWYENSWMSVCADGWDDSGADVVCKALGEYSNAIALTSIPVDYSRSYAVIIGCSGLETNISQCNMSTTYYCQQRALAGVIYTPKVRLVDGHVSATSTSGRVEVFYDGEWGTICDDSWGDDDARVVCNMLGYSSDRAVAFTRARFGEGEGSILLDEVRCAGNELSIFECRHNNWKFHDCYHYEDAGVECGYAPLVVSLKHGHVSKSLISGMVEVTRLGVPGLVCDDLWDSRDAAVICRMLQLPFDRAVALSYGTFGTGGSNFHLSDVQCVGNETSIVYCQHEQWGRHMCSHRENAAVICQLDNGGNESIRLVGGSTTAGTVEILRGGIWGNIGDSLWDDRDAAVICQMLGFPSENATAQVGAHHGHARYPIAIINVRCVGNESSIFDCPHSQTTRSYRLFTVAGVNCNSGSQAKVSVRLINGHFNKDSVSGRVEVFHQGLWGTVCDNGWDKNDARVVCRMLGFSDAKAQSKSQAYFGEGSSEIILSNVRCAGVEGSLSECSHSGWGSHDCNHTQDAGVICQKESLQVWLAGGQVDRSVVKGQFQILYNGRRGTVCDGDWDGKESGVVCKMAGFSIPLDQPPTIENTTTSTSDVPVVFHGLYCNGDEMSILQCRHFTSQPTSAGCSSGSKAADVGCFSEYQSPGAVRLSNGTTTNSSWSGRVEIFHDGQWMSVCSDHWGQNETSTVCRTLGFLFDGGASGENVDSKTTELYQIDCSDTTDVQRCSSLVLNTSDCATGQHVIVTCLREYVPISTEHTETSTSDGTGVSPTTPLNTEQSRAPYTIPYESYYPNFTDDSQTTSESSDAQTPRVSDDSTSASTYTELKHDTSTTKPDTTSKHPTKKANQLGNAKAREAPQTDDDIIITAVVVPVLAIVAVVVVAVLVYRRVKHNTFNLGYVDNKDGFTDGGYFNPVYEKRDIDEKRDVEEPVYSAIDFDVDDGHVSSTQTPKLVFSDPEIHK
ncbi:deleted in malignant brain tumors 1 protein-like [Gigantopelta aegis]|uniref:deleted in malignant brain tumors 1 protein-like n=1 Tax=Gigantopelta aegis TaxID=1735272 RepID=UPI001B88B899|nr:deleted in malignant brain tumors 1 protein-like [Gigantopelta aegis]